MAMIDLEGRVNSGWGVELDPRGMGLAGKVGLTQRRSPRSLNLACRQMN